MPLRMTYCNKARSNDVIANDVLQQSAAEQCHCEEPRRGDVAIWFSQTSRFYDYIVLYHAYVLVYRAPQPFTAPAVRPFMNCFCMHRYSITIGSDARITLANTRFHLEVYAPMAL